MAEKNYREVTVRNPDGTKSTVRAPLGATDDEILEYAADQFYKNKSTAAQDKIRKNIGAQNIPVKKELPANLKYLETAKDQPFARGFKQGIEDVLATVETPFLAAGNKLGMTDLTPEMNRAMMERRNLEGIDPESGAFKAGRIGANILATLPVGPVLGAGAKALGMGNLGKAITTGGLQKLSAPGSSAIQQLSNLPTRLAGGAIASGASAGLVNPEDALMGAGLGMFLPIGQEAIRQPFRYVKEATGPLRESWRTMKGREMFQNWLGKEKAAELGRTITRGVDESKYLPGTPLTTGDILADVNLGKTDVIGSPLMALEQDLSNVPMRGISDTARSILRKQQGLRLSELEDLAGTPALAEEIKNIRTATTAPMRESAFEAARTGAEIPQTLVPKMEQSLGEATENVDKVRRFVAAGERATERAKTLTPSAQPPGVRNTYMGQLAQRADDVANEAAEQSLAAGRDAKVVQAQMENLRAANIQPIDLGAVKQRIEALRGAEGIGINTEKDAILGHILTKLEEAISRGGGVARPGDIDELVKAELQNVAQTLATKRTGVAGGANKHTAELVSSIQKDLIGALDEASNGGYSAYRAKFAELSQPLNQMEVGQGLLQKTIPAKGRENAQSFLTEMRRLETELDPRTGKPLIEAVAPERREMLNKLRNEYERDMAKADLSKGINVGDSEDALKQGATLPALIAKEISITNFITRKLNEQAGGKLTEDIALKMLSDPAGFAAKYLNEVPMSSRQKIVQQVLEGIRTGGRMVPPITAVESER